MLSIAWAPENAAIRAKGCSPTPSSASGAIEKTALIKLSSGWLPPGSKSRYRCELMDRVDAPEQRPRVL